MRVWSRIGNLKGEKKLYVIGLSVCPLLFPVSLSNVCVSIRPNDSPVAVSLACGSLSGIASSTGECSCNWMCTCRTCVCNVNSFIVNLTKPAIQRGAYYFRFELLIVNNYITCPFFNCHSWPFSCSNISVGPCETKETVGRCCRSSSSIQYGAVRNIRAHYTFRRFSWFIQRDFTGVLQSCSNCGDSFYDIRDPAKATVSRTF